MSTSNSDNQLLFSKADDVINLSTLRQKPCFLGFLNEQETYELKEYLRYKFGNFQFYGGYENAKRTIFCSGLYEITYDDFPIKEIYFKFRKVDKLFHRDFLGALMSLGIERSCIGDILVAEGYALCYVKNEIYDYIVSDLTKIGRVGVTIIPKEKCYATFEEKTEELFYTVSSMRLDVVVSAITSLSRSKTNELILAGKVFVNYCEQHNFSYILKENDILTIRGKGKFIFKTLIGETKKGRLKIILEHFR